MEIYYLPKFIRQFKKLPKEIKEVAVIKEKIFRKDHFDSKLDTHKLKGKLKSFWSFSIDKRNRIIFDFKDKKTIRFYSVGNHDIYYE